MTISYQFFEQEKLFIQKFSGLFMFESYMKYAQTIIHSPQSGSIENILIDFRDIVFNEEEGLFGDELERVIKVRRGINAEAPEKRKLHHVFWVDKPLPTVIAQLFKGNFPDMDYTYCSTGEEIVRVFNLPAHLKNIDVIVDKLAFTY